MAPPTCDLGCICECQHSNDWHDIGLSCKYSAAPLFHCKEFRAARHTKTCRNYRVPSTDTCRVVTIPSNGNLDSVVVFLQDFGSGRGRLTVECYGQAWSSFWPAMRGSLVEFILSCDDHYLMLNLILQQRHHMQYKLVKRQEEYLLRIVAKIREALKAEAEHDATA